MENGGWGYLDGFGPVQAKFVCLPVLLDTFVLEHSIGLLSDYGSFFLHPTVKQFRHLSYNTESMSDPVFVVKFPGP